MPGGVCGWRIRGGHGEAGGTLFTRTGWLFYQIPRGEQSQKKGQKRNRRQICAQAISGVVDSGDRWVVAGGGGKITVGGGCQDEREGNGDGEALRIYRSPRCLAL